VGAALFAASALQAQLVNPSSNPQVTSSAAGPADISHRAKDFLQDAVQADQTHVALANIAEQKSQNTAVTELAQKIRADHVQNYAQLQSIAGAHGVVLSDFPDWTHQRTINRLQRSRDADFDQGYIKALIKADVACIKTFDKAVAQVEEPDIRQYAQNTLPTLRDHLRRWEEAARSVGMDKATISSLIKGLPADEVEQLVTFNRN
jgi:putative membrane protein